MYTTIDSKGQFPTIFQNTQILGSHYPSKVKKMGTCAECIHAELQCPPVIRCKLKNTFLYLDSPKCEQFKSGEEEDEDD
jgi:hypothetical protein